jgi:DNA-binding phage protein
MGRKDRKFDGYSTEELMKLIQSSRSLDNFLEDAGENLTHIRTSDYLNQLLEELRLTKQAVIESANLERSTGYLIFSGQRNPKRDSLLRIAIAMQLTLTQTQRLLKIAQRGELYPKNRRDAAIIYGIHHRLDLIELEILLDEIDEKLLT